MATFATFARGLTIALMTVAGHDLFTNTKIPLRFHIEERSKTKDKTVQIDGTDAATGQADPKKYEDYEVYLSCGGDEVLTYEKCHTDPQWREPQNVICNCCHK